ncbi:MAG: ABC transporter permease subunit [Chloroflexota bacterium]
MTDTTIDGAPPRTEKQRPPGGPSPLRRVARVWRRVSASLVPVLAVITALIVIIPMMVLTQGEGDLGRGLRIAGQAYAGLLEGAVGVAVNPTIDTDDLSYALEYIERENAVTEQPIRFNNVNILARRAEDLVEIGQDNIRFYAEVIDRYFGAEPVPDNQTFDTLGNLIPDIQRIGADRLRDYGPLISGFREANRTAVDELADRYAILDTLDLDARTEIEALVPIAAEYNDDDLLDTVKLVDDPGIVRLNRAFEQLQVLDQLGIDALSDEAEAIAAMHQLSNDRRNPNGVDRTLNIAAADTTFENAGTDDVARLANELRLIANLYGEGVLTNPEVAPALREQLPEALEDTQIVRQPPTGLLVLSGAAEDLGTLRRERIDVINTTDEEGNPITVTERVEVLDRVYVNLGSSFLFFSPSKLEETLTRSIPYIIAGLAVALGFKAGLFNIGAEGQLYIGATLAAWIGFASVFQGLPALPHILLVLIAGLLGGALWGMIPGVLKAYTGAHEVITTIMLNFVAIRLVDWLIRTKPPQADYILRDPAADFDRTPLLSESARLPTFDDYSLLVFLLAGIATALFSLWSRREAIREDARNAIRPVVYGALVFVGGVILSWLSVGGALHIGLVVMLVTVFSVDWFLERTTYGFELRTVGANQSAAQYAGMNVGWNIVLALTLSGALAGLAGIVQIAGVQHSMQPEFFAGLGFDAIAVALLARNNPRNMIYAGVLWGALISGAGAIQIYEIPIDVVKIIQALIITFIAADAIIRTLWQVPEATEEEKAAAVFSKGWGG